MAKTTVGVVGASGYSGAVLTRLLAFHPEASVAFCTSDKWAGRSVVEMLGIAGGPFGALSFIPNAQALEACHGAELVFLATSAEVSASLVPSLLAKGKRVIDLSGAFRIQDPSRFEAWYGFAHPAPHFLNEAHYGLPEIFGSPSAATRLIANPGCYPTATLLALQPLLRAGLIDGAGLIVDAKSGVTGAGRQAKEEYSFAEVDEDLRAYKILAHQHTPEIEDALRRSAPASVTFTAHLLPIRRGLLATCYARPRPGTTDKHVKECLQDTYRDASLVRAVGPEQVTLASVAGTAQARVGAAAKDDMVVAVGAIDNLVKGAAGQAVQNMNLLLGCNVARGLEGLSRIAP